MRLTTDNGALAKILATEQSIDREILLKTNDAQITLAVDPNFGVQDQKLELSGRLRRRVFYLKCTCHSTDKQTSGSDSGKTIRNKVTEQINKIIRENRTLPNQATLNFYGLGYPQADPHKAYTSTSNTEQSPTSDTWAELTSLQYQSLWASDEVRYIKSHNSANEFSMMLFKFKINSKKQHIKKLTLSFQGYGTAPTGNGLTLKAYNHTTATWGQTQTTTSNTDQTLTITIQTDIADHVDSNGYVWILTRTTNPSNGTTPSVIYCNYAECTFQVYGVTYCDIQNYRFIDIVDVKPFLFKTEFLLKSWLFETIPS
jgi:hypothetical protein